MGVVPRWWLVPAADVAPRRRPVPRGWPPGRDPWQLQASVARLHGGSGGWREATAGGRFFGCRMRLCSADSDAPRVDPPGYGPWQLLADVARLHGDGGSCHDRMGTRGGPAMAVASDV